jgi:1-acyl-sn-glycerol-3-phosphate acyltransferase
VLRIALAANEQSSVARIIAERRPCSIDRFPEIRHLEEDFAAHEAVLLLRHGVCARGSAAVTSSYRATGGASRSSRGLLGEGHASYSRRVNAVDSGDDRLRVEDGRPRLIDWIFTVPFLLAFGLTLGIFDPLQRIARLFGPRPHEIVVGLLQQCLLWDFKLCGTRIQVERSAAVESWSPYLVISNHQSMFDIPIFGALLFTNFPKYVSKKELARWIPSISYNLRRGGNAIIDRQDPEQALPAIRELAERVRDRGVSAVIYPEGTRARRGEVGTFRPRGTLELLRAAPDVPVLPVAIDGSWRLLRHNLLPVPFGTRVRIWIGEPLPRSGVDDASALLRRTESEIRATVARWRERHQPKVVAH